MIIAARCLLIFVFVSIPVALIAGQIIRGFNDGASAGIADAPRNVQTIRRPYDDDAA